MALELKGLLQVSQDGKYLWFTDSTGEYVVTTNEGGWGTPNVDLGASALLSWVYRMSNPKILLSVVGAALKYNNGAANDDVTQFQHDYLADGYTQFHSVRMMASVDDAQSLDATPIVFTVGDIWWNPNDQQVKELTGTGIVVLDITDVTDLDNIAGNSSVTYLLCETLYWKNLNIVKNGKYTKERDSRRKNDEASIIQMREDQNDIRNGTAQSAYQFSFGLKNEAHDTVESLLDDFKVS